MTTSKRLGAGTTGPLRHGGAGTGTGGGRGGRSARPVDPAALAEVAGRITALAEQKDPQRRSLFVDGEFVMGLSLETIARCGLRQGQAVDGPVLLKIWSMETEQQTWNSAIALLAASPRTVRELGRRLAGRYPEEAVERVLQRLEAAGWLDDAAYARSYIRSRPEYGARRLLADLARKGVESAVAALAVQEALGEVDGAEQATEIAARRLARMSGIDRESARRRLAGYLARRGFGPESISRALATVLEGVPPAERRQGKRIGRRREEAESGEESGGLWRSAPPGSSSLRRSAGAGNSSLHRSGGSSLRRTTPLQRRRPMRAHDEEE